MPRKATKHAQIESEKERISTFKRRLDSFLKKANELSILCGIDVAVLIHNTNDGYSMLWPSEDSVSNLTEKFLRFPERELLRKMVLQEKFLIDEIGDMVFQLSKLQQKANEKEAEFWMNQLNDGKSFESLDLGQLNGLHHFADQKLKELKKRSDAVDGVQENQEVQANSHYFCPETQIAGSTTVEEKLKSKMFAATTTTSFLEQVREEKNFGEASYGLQNSPTLLKATHSETMPTDWTSFLIKTNQGQARDAFNQEWQTFFPS